jgi:hypothetical protein
MSKVGDFFRRLSRRGEGAASAKPTPKVGLSLRLTTATPVVAVLGFAVAAHGSFLAIFAVGIMTSAAAGILGALVGFLFALPKTSDTERSGRLSTNTNLDQVSDWLTKILIGLGLVQIGKVGTGLGNLADSIAPALGGGLGAKTFALGILVYSIIDGFLIGYLGTRIVVTIRLKEVEDILAAKENVLATPPPEPPPPLPPPPAGSQ